jgi:hypothetical protein
MINTTDTVTDLSFNSFGCYRVYDKNNHTYYKDYLNKVEALLEATRLKQLNTNAGIVFRYYSDIWKNFNYSLCGQIPLSVLYKDRAMQLRDKYEFLILKYSGGSDSHNILMTFLKNNIKLDAIYVNWPVSAKSKNLYTPNNSNFSPKNELSEWDYVIKPDLDWISKNHPDIKIYVDDWLENITTEKRIDDTQFQKQNHFLSPASFYRMQHFSNFEKNLFDKSINVGIIEGADKPNLYISDLEPNKVVSRFVDWPLQHNLTFGSTGTEYFYITPDYPLLTVEMAYQVYLHYKNNKGDRWLLYPLSKFNNLSKEKALMLMNQTPQHIKDEICKKVLYPYWNPNRFQVKKDVEVMAQVKIGKPQDWVFWNHHETKPIQDKWNHHIKSYLNGIDGEYLNFDKNNTAICFKPTFSGSFGGNWLLD